MSQNGIAVNLPVPGPAYDANNEAQARRLLQIEDGRNVKTSDYATVEQRGIVKPDGTTITVDRDATIHAFGRVIINYSYRDIAALALNAVQGRACSVLAWRLPSVANGLVVAGRVDRAPVSDTDFLLLKDGATVATVRFGSGSNVPTLITDSADADFTALTDYLDLKTPAALNGMSGVICITVLGKITA